VEIWDDSEAENFDNHASWDGCGNGIDFKGERFGS
jgi:hypothetical protein